MGLSAHLQYDFSDSRIDSLYEERRRVASRRGRENVRQLCRLAAGTRGAREWLDDRLIDPGHWPEGDPVPNGAWNGGVIRSEAGVQNTGFIWFDLV
jgi:hypothetical protein